MSAKENEVRFRQVLAAYNQGNRKGFHELYSPQIIYHQAGTPDIKGIEAYQKYDDVILAAFPDAQFTIEDLIASGDKIVWRYTARGTHKGPFMGVPPTGKEIAFKGIVIERFEDDLIVEEWSVSDRLSLFQQLGLIPVRK
jgi:steroid delta-isomerase-like uncharacterized protein